MSFPLDWYWLASDGRVFASARCATVAKDDAGYAAWCGVGNTASTWPCDDVGAQTSAALDIVLQPYGLSTSGPIRTVRGAVLVKALDKTTKVCARDLAYVAALDLARENMASIARIAAVDGRDAKTWFDAALGTSA